MALPRISICIQPDTEKLEHTIFALAMDELEKSLKKKNCKKHKENSIFFFYREIPIVCLQLVVLFYPLGCTVVPKLP